MNSEDVGKVFRKADGTYWVMDSYLSEPGVSFQRIDTSERTIMVGVNSLIARGYERVDVSDELATFLYDTARRVSDFAQLVDKDKLG